MAGDGADDRRASWLVGSASSGRRRLGFWLFLVSNGLWVSWGLHDTAPALVTLQFALAAMNIRGACRAEPPEADPAAAVRR